jgi:hypothetical protein
MARLLGFDTMSIAGMCMRRCVPDAGVPVGIVAKSRVT